MTLLLLFMLTLTFMLFVTFARGEIACLANFLLQPLLPTNACKSNVMILNYAKKTTGQLHDLQPSVAAVFGAELAPWCFDVSLLIKQNGGVVDKSDSATHNFKLLEPKFNFLVSDCWTFILCSTLGCVIVGNTCKNYTNSSTTCCCP